LALWIDVGRYDRVIIFTITCTFWNRRIEDNFRSLAADTLGAPSVDRVAGRIELSSRSNSAALMDAVLESR